jgi:ABC-2 type transport system permease protein
MIGARLKAIIVKEIWSTLRDPRARILLIAPPLIQLLIFGFASTMEVNNIRVGVLDMDNGRWSREIIERINASPNVREVVPLASDADLRRAVNRQRVIVALRFDPRFSADVSSGRGGTIGAVYDGRRSNAAQIVNGYIERIASDANALVAPHMAGAGGASLVTHWYNPNIDNLWFIMPALIAVIASTSALAVVTQSVARERELGTFDQLMVSPLRTYEILAGKMMAPILAGLVNVLVFVMLVPTVFGVPLTGSLTFFCGALFFYLLALTGVGMLISVISTTQQQAFLGMFAVTIPMIILSGYASPVDNMPAWLRVIAWVDPTSWFLEVSEGTFLKAMSAREVLSLTWPIILIAAVTLTAAAALFRSRME